MLALLGYRATAFLNSLILKKSLSFLDLPTSIFGISPLTFSINSLPFKGTLLSNATTSAITFAPNSPSKFPNVSPALKAVGKNLKTCKFPSGLELRIAPISASLNSGIIVFAFITLMF